MKRDIFMRGLLLVIAVLLALNLWGRPISTVITPEANAGSVRKLTFRGNGTGVACSADGKYVYASSNGAVYRSSQFGKAGTWEPVIP